MFLIAQLIIYTSDIKHNFDKRTGCKFIYDEITLDSYSHSASKRFKFHRHKDSHCLEYNPENVNIRGQIIDLLQICDLYRQSRKNQSLRSIFLMKRIKSLSLIVLKIKKKCME